MQNVTIDDECSKCSIIYENMKNVINLHNRSVLIWWELFIFDIQRTKGSIEMYPTGIIYSYESHNVRNRTTI